LVSRDPPRSDRVSIVVSTETGPLVDSGDHCRRTVHHFILAPDHLISSESLITTKEKPQALLSEGLTAFMGLGRLEPEAASAAGDD